MGLNSGTGSGSWTDSGGRHLHPKGLPKALFATQRNCWRVVSSPWDLLLRVRAFLVSPDVGLNNGTRCGSWTDSGDAHGLPKGLPKAVLAPLWRFSELSNLPWDLLPCVKAFSVTPDVGLTNGTQHESWMDSG